MGMGDEIIVYEHEDEDCWAVYRNGSLQHSGEGMNDCLEALERLSVIKHRVRDDSMFLGDEDRDSPAGTVQEIEQFNALPDWEKEARELEARAAHLREGRNSSGY